MPKVDFKCDNCMQFICYEQGNGTCHDNCATWLSGACNEKFCAASSANIKETKISCPEIETKQDLSATYSQHISMDEVFQPLPPYWYNQYDYYSYDDGRDMQKPVPTMKDIKVELKPIIDKKPIEDMLQPYQKKVLQTAAQEPMFTKLKMPCIKGKITSIRHRSEEEMECKKPRKLRMDWDED